MLEERLDGTAPLLFLFIGFKFTDSNGERTPGWGRRTGHRREGGSCLGLLFLHCVRIFIRCPVVGVVMIRSEVD